MPNLINSLFIELKCLEEIKKRSRTMGTGIEGFTFIGQRNGWINLMAIALRCRYFKLQLELATQRLLKTPSLPPLRRDCT
jgi:hypothetical protein